MRYTINVTIDITNNTQTRMLVMISIHLSESVCSKYSVAARMQIRGISLRIYATVESALYVTTIDLTRLIILRGNRTMYFVLRVHKISTINIEIAIISMAATEFCVV